MTCEDVFKDIDRALALLEAIEEEVGRLAGKARAGERLGSGEVYRLYTLIVSLGDRLRVLRKHLYTACSQA